MSYSFLYFVFWSVIKIDELIFINFVILFILASYCAIRSIIKIDNQIFIYFFIPGPSFLLFSFLPNPSSAPWLPFPPFQVCPASGNKTGCIRSEEHTSELQSRPHLVCRLLLEKKNK